MIIEASKKKRLINFVIDIVAMGFLVEMTFWLEVLFKTHFPLDFLRVMIVFGAYYILLEFFLGKTVGKYFTKTKVVNREGGKINFREAVLRYLCRWIPFEYLSLGLGVDAKAWHDTLSKTHVIDEVESKKLTQIDHIGAEEII